MPRDLTELGAVELSSRIARGAVGSGEVMARTLDRIEALNPRINAIVSLRPRPELMAEAKAMEAAPRRGWLHGIPVAVKDLVATEGLRTTWGSPLFADFIPETDDLVAARLRAAGAIIIGKTNTPEWGHGSHTFNTVHGTTLNPYDTTRSAGGSSGGAAAALAARLLSVADGSDMMGSLRNPAAFCNVYGFRPSWGLVPQDAEGDTFLTTLATEGPMGRSPADVAALLSTLAGPHSATPFGRAAEPYTEQLNQPVGRCRIGWLADWGGAYPLEPGISDLCESALGVFERLGAEVEPLDPPFPAEDLWHAWTTLRAMLNAGSKGDLCRDPEKRARIKPESLWEVDQGQDLSAADVYAASLIRSRWYAAAGRLFHRYDALALPSAQVWPFPSDWRWPRQINGRQMDTYHRWMEIVVPVSLIGLPCLGLPAGFGADGLPMGMQLFGPSGSDARILALGHAYHGETNWPSLRPPPV